LRKLTLDANAPILALTANVFAGDRARAAEAGMNDFIAKPVKSEVLFSTMLKWLKKPHTTGQCSRATPAGPGNGPETFPPKRSPVRDRTGAPTACGGSE